jgi:hypothetical protein
MIDRFRLATASRAENLVEQNASATQSGGRRSRPYRLFPAKLKMEIPAE